MDPTLPHAASDHAGLSDSALAARIVRGDHEAFRQLMMRCNQRLFRVARGVLASDHEAEDVVQEAYVRAYQALPRFRGESTLLTWLTRIVVNEARQRLRDRRDTIDVRQIEQAGASSQVLPFPNASGEDPMAGAARAELRRALEQAIDALPAGFRVVYVLREIEECSVEETATQLGLRPETVKTRLHRARRLLRRTLEQRVADSLKEAFPFLGVRCARICERVLARVGAAGRTDRGQR